MTLLAIHWCSEWICGSSQRNDHVVWSRGMTMWVGADCEGSLYQRRSIWGWERMRNSLKFSVEDAGGKIAIKKAQG